MTLEVPVWLFVLLSSLALAQEARRDNKSGQCLTRHKPIYFVSGLPKAWGTNREAQQAVSPVVKFQVSFRYKLIGWQSQELVELFSGDDAEDGPSAPRRPLCNTEEDREFFVGYTQKALWDLYADSAPFEEVNHNPEVFYRQRVLGVPWFTRVQLGFEHESNGEASPGEGASCNDLAAFGQRSCSWNRVYIEPRFAYALGEKTRVRVYTRLWLVLGLQIDENPDIAERMGRYQARVAIDRDIKRVFTSSAGNPRLTVELATRKNANLVGVDWSFLQTITRFSPHIYVQGFHGYGETLRNYAGEDILAIRAGIRLSQ